MLFGQFILQPSLTGLATSFRSNQKKAFNKIVMKISSIIVLSLIVIIPVAYFLGIPVLNIVYGVNLNEYRMLLILIIIGAAFYTISQILLNALITLRCTKEQLYLQLITLVLSIIISMLLVEPYGVYGSVMSYFCILVMQFMFYLVLYIVQINKKFD